MRAASLTALTAVLALAAAGCGGSSSSSETTAQALAQPGSAWAKLSLSDRQEALRACRLDVAIAAAKRGGIASAPYLTTDYDAVVGLSGDALRPALDRWFADPAHQRQRIADGCRTVVSTAAQGVLADRPPTIDFASPVVVSHGSLALTLNGVDHVGLLARLAPAGARVHITPAPGRSRTTTRTRVSVHAGRAAIALSRVPRGISYLRVAVTARGASWDRLLVIHRRDAAAVPAPRTFAPMTISGQGSRGIPLLYLPQPAKAIAQTDGAPLALTASDTLLLAHGSGDTARSVPIAAGRYLDVQVNAPGAWTIRIVPAA